MYCLNDKLRYVVHIFPTSNILYNAETISHIVRGLLVWKLEKCNFECAQPEMEKGDLDARTRKMRGDFNARLVMLRNDTIGEKE